MAFLRVIYMQNSLILNRCTYPLLLAYGLTHTFEQPFKFDHLHLGSVHTFHAIEFHYEEWPLKSLSIYFFLSTARLKAMIRHPDYERRILRLRFTCLWGMMLLCCSTLWTRKLFNLLSRVHKVEQHHCFVPRRHVNRNLRILLS